MNKKISTNIFFNILNQIVSLVTPLILSPYIARVLSADLIGDYSYSLANSSYFVLIEALGFSLYGMLKVARYRDDKKIISVLFKEIMIAKIILMILCSFVYVVLFIFPVNANKALNTIMILNIISTGIDATWFLLGMEDFKATTLRNIFVRFANVLLVILLVKTEKDFYIYAFVMQSSTLISYLAVLPLVKKYLIPTKVSARNIITHTKNSLCYIIPGIINTIFTSADKTVLGAFTNNYEVGVYEQASKITSLCGAVINSISNVLLPRVTYLNRNGLNDESKQFLFKTVRFALVLSIPVTAGIICIADNFVPFFFGSGYEKSSILLKILSINVLMTVVANYLGQQCLVGNSRQREYNICISIGAVLNVILNLAVVKATKSVGVSVSSVISSVVVCGVILFFSKEIISLRKILSMSWRSLFSVIIMSITIYNIGIYNNFCTILIKAFIGIVVYFFSLFIFKEDLLIEIIKKQKTGDSGDDISI